MPKVMDFDNHFKNYDVSGFRREVVADGEGLNWRKENPNRCKKDEGKQSAKQIALIAGIVMDLISFKIPNHKEAWFLNKLIQV